MKPEIIALCKISQTQNNVESSFQFVCRTVGMCVCVSLYVRVLIDHEREEGDVKAAGWWDKRSHMVHVP